MSLLDLLLLILNYAHFHVYDHLEQSPSRSHKALASSKYRWAKHMAAFGLRWP